MSQAQANPLAAYVANAQFNTLYPYNLLPWNTAPTRIQSNPYYLANELTNIEARQFKTPLIFDPNAQAVALNSPVIPTDLTPFFPTSGSLNVFSHSSKIFQGTVYDSSTQTTGNKYQYMYTGVLSNTTNFGATGTANWAMIGLDLKTPPTISSNISVQYTTGTKNGCDGAPCTLGNTCYVSISGTVTYGTQTGAITQPIPYLNSTTGCPPAGSSYFTINGKRIYILLKFSANSPASNTLSYNITIDVIERLTVPDPALVPVVIV